VLFRSSDGYSYQKDTSAHNTILVNGQPQKGSDKGQWTQPLKGADADMSRLAFITTYQDAGDVVVAEGEASNAYAGLDRFRRAVIWVKGKYLLVLDDIRGPAGTQVTWLNQSLKVEAVDAPAGVYRLTNKTAGGKDSNATILMQLVANQPIAAAIGDSPACDRKESMGYRQLQAKMPGEKLRVAAIYDAWKKGDVRVALAVADDGVATVTVTGSGCQDTWGWLPASAKDRPAIFQATGSTQVTVGPGAWATIPYPGMGKPQPQAK
jgi:hypothetical protein